jgi:hypothetical protein
LLPVTPWRFLSLKYDVLNLWLELDLGRPVVEVVPSPAFAAVWRRGFEIFHIALSPIEAEALRRVLEGQTLDNVCQAFAGQPDAAQVALRAIGVWFAEGWMIAS